MDVEDEVMTVMLAEGETIRDEDAVGDGDVDTLSDIFALVVIDADDVGDGVIETVCEFEVLTVAEIDAANDDETEIDGVGDKVNDVVEVIAG